MQVLRLKVREYTMNTYVHLQAEFVSNAMLLTMCNLCFRQKVVILLQ